jgi:hypothetical protein
MGQAGRQSFLFNLSAKRSPWRLRLERVRGTTGFDGLERISTQTLLDICPRVRARRQTSNLMGTAGTREPATTRR